MSGAKCIAPNCNNSTTIGIPLPKQKELQEKWFESLGITDFALPPTSFVCLNHFTNRNETDLENALEELPVPVPTITTTGNESAIKKTIYDGNNLHLFACRLCMGEDDVTVNVFSKLYNNVTVANAISKCIPDIKITRLDNLSKLICTTCLEKVESYYNFRTDCLVMDVKQKEIALNKQAKRQLEESGAYGVKSIKKTKTQTDKKFDNVEAELMKALEGKLSDEMKNADNIIIQVQSDDESEHSTNQNVISLNDSNLIQVGSTEIKLPKSIKINVNNKPPPPVMTNAEEYPATIVCGVQNSEFCLSNSYLYEFRLSKGSSRRVKCIENTCKSTGVFENINNENKVVVKIAHNHPPPSQSEMKKLMFLHLMCRKMQSDKSLNFKNVYDEMCEEDPAMKKLISLKTVINQICSEQMKTKTPTIESFERFYNLIETEALQSLHFTHMNKQFYQDKLTASDESQAIIFANRDTIQQYSDSKIIYVDSSFKIETNECFDYQLVTVLVWVSDSFYPIMFALISDKSQEIYKAIFSYLRDNLAPNLRPEEIVTDYEAPLYYSLGETYLESYIGGSVFYYTQNIYKKICALNLSRKLETDSCFRNIYHMILMLPLLPVNTIQDGLNNIEIQAAEMNLAEITKPIFDYVRSEWIIKVTPDLFCVHRLENRINENVIAPFKKLRDFLMLSKGKLQKQQVTVVSVVEKLIELESFLQATYSAPSKKSFARDLSSSQKKHVIRAWQFIESYPKININNFFSKVLGYVKCMENQLWIWGFYRYSGDASTDLISAENFSIINPNEVEESAEQIADESESNYDHVDYVYHAENGEVVMDVVIEDADQGEFVLDNTSEADFTDTELQ